MTSPTNELSETEEGVDTDTESGPPSAKRKHHVAATYNSKYARVWIETYPCVQPVKDDPRSFHCSVCGKNVSCKHMGLGDVKCHIQGLNHQKAAKGMEKQTKLSFVSTKSPIMKKVIRQYMWQVIIESESYTEISF